MIPTSLLKLGSDSANRAVKMFAGILKYLSEDGSQDANTSPSKSARIDLVQKLLHQVLRLCLSMRMCSCLCTCINLVQKLLHRVLCLCQCMFMRERECMWMCGRMCCGCACACGACD